MILEIPKKQIQLQNFIGGQWVVGSGEKKQILSPYTNTVIGEYSEATDAQVKQAIESAKKGFQEWSRSSLKERTQVMFRFRHLLQNQLDEISNIISSESGKTPAEARAGLLKGIEVLEFALSLQNLDHLGKMEVSKGVFCEYRREPLGVVAGITPFNFPAMVPMWMIPIAITLGNSFVWKPSDKTPLTSKWIADAISQAGAPKGVLTTVNGGKSVVDAILKHPDVRAVGFVGSSPVAKYIYQTGTQNFKRILALGGAKNHIFLMPDADPEITAQGIADSFTGCAGQRCMAASVLLAVGNCDSLIHKITEHAKKITLGTQMGAIINKNSLKKLESAIQNAESNGAKIILDGRNPRKPKGFENGNWLAPTILDNVKPNSEAACEELFGPILSIIRCKNLEEAMKIENENPYGNAASIFTQNGSSAEFVAQNARAGMVGINIGVPVPREPFSFGGLYESKFGYGDITGESSLNFWSNLKKLTTKWSNKSTDWMS